MAVAHGSADAGQLPPVHRQQHPGDEAGLVGGEKQRRVGGIPPVAHEAQRDACDALGDQGVYVAAGPLVRSSYRAGELFIRTLIQTGGRNLAGTNSPTRETA